MSAADLLAELAQRPREAAIILDVDGTLAPIVARPEEASYIVPGGASGHPGSPHFADQLELWARCERVPMHRDRSAVEAAPVSELQLIP